jgi:hypothetical protein
LERDAEPEGDDEVQHPHGVHLLLKQGSPAQGGRDAGTDESEPFGDEIT